MSALDGRDHWAPSPPPVIPLDDLPPQPGLRRVKVLHVLTKFAAGAGGNTLLSAAGMDRERYEVWIAGSDEGPLWDRARQAGLRLAPLGKVKREISPIADLLVLFRMVRLIRRERFAVVHAHNAKAGFLGRLAAWLCRTPVILYTLHGRDPWWQVPDGDDRFEGTMGRGARWVYLRLERLFRPMTRGFIAVSPQVARDAVESRIARPGSVAVAPSAVELDRIPFEPDRSARRELGIPDDVTLVGTVGRADPQKAPLDFVRMAHLVGSRKPNAVFVWVGDGELVDEARAEAARLGVDVLFTGYRADAPRIASSFDVYVVSSRYEGVGRSLTEALACARPVVATAVDGVLDVVRPGATGLLAPPRDPARLAEAVCWMLDHPREARRMGEAGRTFVRTLFEPEVMCAILDRIYSHYLGLSPLQPQVSSPGGSVPVDGQWTIPAWAGGDGPRVTE
jgi:glycosyltransferase involved in cell wall biosynthesis